PVQGTEAQEAEPEAVKETHRGQATMGPLPSAPVAKARKAPIPGVEPSVLKNLKTVAPAIAAPSERIQEIAAILPASKPAATMSRPKEATQSLPRSQAEIPVPNIQTPTPWPRKAGQPGEIV